MLRNFKLLQGWYESCSILPHHCTEVRFASFLSGGFITVIVVNPPERKLAKRTSAQCHKINKFDEKFVDLGPVDFIFQTCYKVRNDMKSIPSTIIDKPMVFPPLQSVHSHHNKSL